VAHAVSHAALGCAAAAAQGNDCEAGAIGAAASAIASNFLSPELAYDADSNSVHTANTLGNTLLSAIVPAVGALAAQAVGEDAMTGFNAAQNEWQNNRLLHPTEIAKIKTLASNWQLLNQLHGLNFTSQEDAQWRLTVAACGIAQCAAGYANAPAELTNMQAIGASWNFSRETSLLANTRDDWAPVYQTHQLGRGGVARTDLGADDFDYTTGDGVRDWSDRNNLGTRTAGGIQLVFGSLESAGGLALMSTCELVLTCAAGAFLTGQGWDYAKAGGSMAWNGAPATTFGERVLQNTFGLSPAAASLGYGLLGLSPVGVEAFLTNRAGNTLAASNVAARATYSTGTSQILDQTADALVQAEVSALRRIGDNARTQTVLQHLRATGAPQEVIDAAMENRAGNIVVVGSKTAGDTPVALDWARHEVLSRNDWSIAVNDGWIKEATDRRAIFYLASPQTDENLWNAYMNAERVFGRELNQLRAIGYRQVGDYMVPPKLK
jgi:hypothetical protein